jgi:beta-N-acetylhexosaminidase
MKDLSSRTKILSLIIAGFAGSNKDVLESDFIELLQDGLGGVILFGYNIGSALTLKEMISSIKSQSQTDLLVAIDQEGGKVARLVNSKGYKEFLSAEAVSKQYTPEEAKNYYSEMALMLNDLGFNLNFAPIVDLKDENCKIIAGYGRSYSENPEIVAKYAGAFVEALEEREVLACLKHFPGHGLSRDDSHDGLVDITNYANPESELLPYKILTNKASMIMTAHVINKNIDPIYPVTLSKNYIQPILREQIKFEGLVVADDLMMKSIMDYYSTTEAFIKAICAGVNMVIISLFQGSTLQAAGDTEAINLTEIVDQLVAEYEVNQEFRDAIDKSYDLKTRILDFCFAK